MRIIENILEKDSFGNAWQRGLSAVLRNNNHITFGDVVEPKRAMEIGLNIELVGNALKEALEYKLHPQFPTKELHKQAYINEWNRDFDWKKQGFLYSYEDRCHAYMSSWKRNFNTAEVSIDQWKLTKEDIEEQIHTGISSNRNVIVIGNPSIDRYEIATTPPCLREIWLRYEGKDTATGKNLISVSTVWRSRDGYAAWMTNICGLLSAVVREIGIPTNSIICHYEEHIKSFHIYHWDWDDAKKIRRIPTILR